MGALFRYRLVLSCHASGQELLHGGLIRSELARKAGIVVFVRVEGQDLVIVVRANGFAPKKRAIGVVLDQENVADVDARDGTGAEIRLGVERSTGDNRTIGSDGDDCALFVGRQTEVICP